MNLLDRYIIRSHIAPFFFGVSIVVFLFLMQFIIRVIDQLIGKGLSFWVISQLIVLNTAWMVVIAVPIGVLFSTLMAFGNMSANHEVTIVKASGGSLIRMMMPVIVIGILLTTGLFWFNDYILPESNHQAKILLSDIKRKKPTFELESGQFSTQLDGYTILSRKVDSSTGWMYGVTIYDRRNLNQMNVVSADSGFVQFANDMTHLEMNLFDGEIHQMRPEYVDNYRIVDFETYKIHIKASGFAFARSGEDMMSRGDREMHISDMREITDDAMKRAKESGWRIRKELKKHYRFLSENYVTEDTARSKIKRSIERNTADTSRASALNRVQKRVNFLRSTIQSDISQQEIYTRKARQYEVEIQKKYAIPFACMVFLLVGCPLGIKTRGGNFGMSAAITVGFYIIYWACLIGGEKLADRGFLSPVLSMWLGNIVIGVFGIILTMKVNSETLAFPGAKFFRKHFRKKS